jgi:hypothetical protein
MMGQLFVYGCRSRPWYQSVFSNFSRVPIAHSSPSRRIISNCYALIRFNVKRCATDRAIPARRIACCAACPCRKLCTWRTGANRVMLVADDSAARIALWCAHWAVALQRTA